MDKIPNKINWSDCICHRVLVQRRSIWSDSLYEVTVMEVSKQGRVKLQFLTGAKQWYGEDDYRIVEDLGYNYT